MRKLIIKKERLPMLEVNLIKKISKHPLTQRVGWGIMKIPMAASNYYKECLNWSVNTRKLGKHILVELWSRIYNKMFKVKRIWKDLDLDILLKVNQKARFYRNNRLAGKSIWMTSYFNISWIPWENFLMMLLLKLSQV